MLVGGKKYLTFVSINTTLDFLIYVDEHLARFLVVH